MIRRFDLVLTVPLATIVAMVAGVLVALSLRVSLTELWQQVLSAEVRFAVGLSLRTSLMALAVSLLLAVPAAYAMSRRDFPGIKLVDTILDIPLVMPPLVAGLGLLILLSRSALGAPLARLGVDALFSPVGVVVAQSFIAISVVLRSARAAFGQVDGGYGQAAATLGAGPAAVFFWVDLPLAARGIAAGTVLAWARTLGEFGATLMVAGATRFKTETLPMAVYLNIATGDTEAAVSCALVLMVIAFVVLMALRLLKTRGAT
ncbi:MAG: ABC transporter permease [Magnetospirillum sp.]